MEQWERDDRAMRRLIGDVLADQLQDIADAADMSLCHLVRSTLDMAIADNLVQGFAYLDAEEGDENESD